MTFYHRRDLSILIAVAVGGLATFVSLVAAWGQQPPEGRAELRQFLAEAHSGIIVFSLCIGGLASILTLVVLPHKRWSPRGIMILLLKVALTAAGATVIAAFLIFILVAQGHH